MSEITWKYVKQLMDLDLVDSFLAQNRVQLRGKIVEVIKKYNGGRPSPNIFNTDRSRERVFKSLLSYNHEDMENIYIIYPQLFKGTELYPIGTDPSGDFICVDLEKQTQFILWDHESENREIILDLIPEIFEKKGE